MNEVHMSDLFETPVDYVPPSVNDLPECTEYPNLNSTEYARKGPNFTIKLNKFYEAIDINEEGNIALATNDYTGRTWDGTLWGFDKSEDVGNTDKATYKLQCQSTISDVKFAEKNILLIAESSGSFQMWSTYSEVRSTSGYCLFMLGNVSEHVGIINAIEVCKMDQYKAVTVDTDFCIKLWDLGAGDLIKSSSMKNAHFDSITGVSSSPITANVFVTCSRDKSLLMWDTRLRLPCSAIYEDHECAFTVATWNTDKKNNNIVLVGDDIGQIHLTDIRKPQSFISTIDALDRAVNKIKTNTKYFAVCGDSNEIKVYDLVTNKIVFKNDKSKNYIRDACWDPKDKEALYTIDWDSKLKKNKITE